jgi:hypothetical protein
MIHNEVKAEFSCQIHSGVKCELLSLQESDSGSNVR